MKKNLLFAAIAAAYLAGAAAPAVAATASKTAASKSTKSTKKARASSRGRKAAAAAPVAAAAAIPANAEKWSCNEARALYIAGDMKRDQILTVNFDGHNYKLPRVATTTGADRFYDAATGMDLVVIPFKAMLFNDRGDRTRLADECKTQAMAQENAPAPTQSNALLRDPVQSAPAAPRE
ncbi:hypothetical protein [Chitinasiproducens palmae]|uniref:Uncharacterized protein n=1 Tax=Chitinasiproducens palmae TaxID=1770053 RepID=A0A1H2PP86_9BURK|nr:hypothetical protein [Chitinasiproducens palmae]SDV47690.1 hypothetical protein SAMN05216551_103220 [Chitinasiproducens palmae]